MSLDYLKVDLACTVIKLAETTDGNTPLVDQVAAYLAQNKYLVLDAEGINFTSMEIGELVNLANDFCKAWEGNACYIGIVNLTSSAATVFSITKLDRIFPRFDSVSAALNHFQNGPVMEMKAAP